MNRLDYEKVYKKNELHDDFKGNLDKSTYIRDMAPKVSVIVPNYNHAPYLRQRLDSIFNQTFQDFEVIILDDCSTDNSREIIEKYRSRPQVSHIVYNETNSGSPFKQWAKGLNLAQGEYIWIAESDDWAETLFLSTLVTVLENNKNCSIAYCRSIWEYKDKSIIDNLFLKSNFYNGISFIKAHFCWDNAICNASSAVFKKEASLNIGTDYQEFFGSGDYLFWIHICEQGNVFFESSPLNHFRQHINNTTIINKKNAGIYFENLKIHDYMQSKGYMSFFRRHSSIAAYLRRIEEDISISKEKSSFICAQKAWRNRTFSKYFSYFISSIGCWLWNIVQKCK